MSPTRVSRRALLCLLIACASPIRFAAAQQPEPRPIAILGVAGEVADVEAQLTGARTEQKQGVTFLVGTIGSRRVVLAKTNAGKVNAAMVATLVINHYAPSAVFFTGTAGAIDPDLKPGDVVVASTIGYHDFGAAMPNRFLRRATINPVTKGTNPEFFPADERLLATARRVALTVTPGPTPGTTRVPVVREGRVVTGDAFVANPVQRDEMRHVLMASAVEMEGAAVAQVGWQLGVPVLVIRSITDSTDGATPDAYRVNVNAASRNAAMLTLAVIAQLPMPVIP